MTEGSDFGDPTRADDVGLADGSLGPAEATDSDEVRNRDGDEVVEPPEHWFVADKLARLGAGERESLAQKLAAEEGEWPRNLWRSSGAEDFAPPQVYRDAHGHHGQIDGTPEDGDSLFPIVE